MQGWCVAKLGLPSLVVTLAGLIGLRGAARVFVEDRSFGDFPPWFEAGAPWGVGGDSHVSVSPFEELRALEYSQRLRMRVRVVASEESSPDVGANLWSRAAAGGAQAVGQPVGAIAPIVVAGASLREVTGVVVTVTDVLDEPP